MVDCMINKCFHQVCDKSSTAEIKSIKWSPASDLAAVIGKDGDVCVHRLYWQKVWSVQEKDVAATCIAWHPEGRTLAIGYDNGLIKLAEIEEGTIVSVVDIGAKSSVVSLDWIFFDDENNIVLHVENQNPTYSATNYVHSLITLMENEPTQSGSNSSQKLPRTSEEPTKTNMLFVGARDGTVVLLLNGILKLATVNIPNLEHGNNLSNCSTALTDEKSKLSVAFSLISEEQTTFRVSFFGSGLLSSRSKEISIMGSMFIFMNSLLQTCDKVITQMSDSWEDILLRVSGKLNKLDEMLPKGSSVAEEFLLAFVCGTASTELQSFLLHDLTLKGLKMLGNNVSACYRDIKELALHKLQMYCHSLLQCLTEVRGMSRWYDKYGVLGLSEELTQTCISSLGVLTLKVREVIQVINSDMKNFRAFLRWITGVVLGLSDEPGPKGLKEFSQEHYSRILYFLQTHLKKSEHEPHFQLERVGQYLKKEDLGIELEYSKNSWHSFVLQCPELKESPLLLQPAIKTSLVIAFSLFKNGLNNLYDKVSEGISKSFEFHGNVDLLSIQNTHSNDCYPSIHQEPVGSTDINLFCLPCSCDCNMFYRFKISQPFKNIFCQVLNFSSTDMPFCRVGNLVNLNIKAIAYFDNNSLIAIVRSTDHESNDSDIMLQLDMSFLNEPMFSCKMPMDATQAMPLNINSSIFKLRQIDINNAAYLSVSGARKVASITSKNCRRVQVYDIVGEEDDDEINSSHMVEEEP